MGQGDADPLTVGAPRRRHAAATGTLLVAVVVLSTVVGCRRSEGAAEATVQAFLTATEGYGRDVGTPERVFRLLCNESRERLRAAAERATALGLPAKPEQMLIRWSPAAWSVERLVFDGKSTVDVYGADPRTQHARVEVDREGGGFCVKLPRPPDGA